MDGEGRAEYRRYIGWTEEDDPQKAKYLNEKLAKVHMGRNLRSSGDRDGGSREPDVRGDDGDVRLV